MGDDAVNKVLVATAGVLSGFCVGLLDLNISRGSYGYAALNAVCLASNVTCALILIALDRREK